MAAIRTDYVVDSAAIDRAAREMARELGDDRVSFGDTLREYRDPFWVQGSTDFDAAAMVSPTSVEQIQAIVRIANAHKVPLWTFSQGRNYGYGGAAARLRGTILVNFREMNRILELNEDLAYAVVEPGVRWFDLFDALEAAGGRLWSSVPDLGGAAWSATVWNMDAATRGLVITPPTSSAWRSYSPMAGSCAPAWGP